jgi:ketosteroid isomerase-like protein
MRFLTILAGLLSMTTGCASARPAALSLSDIAPRSAALDSAYRRGDAAAAAAEFTDSVLIAAEGIPDLTPRRTVQVLLTQFFSANRVAAFTLKPVELRAAGRQAFERGTFVWAAGPKTGSMVTRNGRYFVLRVRESDGVWRIHRYIENCLPAPCP